MALHVYNTLTRKKDEFVPAHPQVVRLYACGLTVYSNMHIGHARTYCFWDTFKRYLEYRNYNVMSVINYTDIDDRLMENANEQLGPMDIAEKVIATFKRDCRLLKIRDYSVYTRATDFVAGQIEMVVRLLEAGHAYVVNGEVFYDVSSFKGYGKLSGRKVEEQQVGASGRVGEDVSRKRHPADFTLWKPSADGQPSWQTGQAEWPSGRPGWHIECSVMSSATLGETFDLHGGAVDNLFPHHENEIAQSEPLCGCDTWVKYWMHPEHLDLRGEKMSKSLGNVVDVPEVTERHGSDNVRWFFAMNHYRTKMAYSDELIESAAEGFAKITRLVKILEDKLTAADEAGQGIPERGEYVSLREGDAAVPRLRHYYTYGKFGEISEKFITSFIAGMDDDVNTPAATAAMFDYVNELYAAGIENLPVGVPPAVPSPVGQDSVPADDGSQAETLALLDENRASVLAAYRCLTRHLWVFGIEFANEALYPQLAVECFAAGGSGGGDEALKLSVVIDNLLAARNQARKDKDFAKADMLRDVLAAAGLTVEDTADGARWRVE